jgi:hypothetical protein
MLRNDQTIPLGTKVSYNGDPRVTGVVVGHGTVDNTFFEMDCDSRHVYHVVIVSLDNGMALLPATTVAGFCVPFVPSILTVLDGSFRE